VYRVSAVARDPGFALVMKVPAVGAGQPPLALVAFETEGAILPAARWSLRSALRGCRRSRAHAVPRDGAHRRYEPCGHRRARAASDDEVARIGAALADAVYSIHLQEVQHLDLKPENFIVRPSGEAVLIDFGYARHARYPDLLAEERHFAAGSAPYVSPEQLNGRRGDPRSDLFALGALLYELASGEPPFGTPNTYAGMRDRLWRAPVPLRSLRPTSRHGCRRSSCIFSRSIRAALRQLGPRGVRSASPGTGRAHRSGPSHAGSGFCGPDRALVARAARIGSAAGVPRVPAPVIMVGVDTEHPDDDRLYALQSATRQLIGTEPRLYASCACRSFMLRPLGEGEALSDTASGRHLEHAIRLRHWAEPLGLPPLRQSLHVIEGADGGRCSSIWHAPITSMSSWLGAPRPGDRTLGCGARRPRA
jgi:serine/threonine protein kinase